MAAVAGILHEYRGKYGAPALTLGVGGDQGRVFPSPADLETVRKVAQEVRTVPIAALARR
jgi:hypothetical protein